MGRAKLARIPRSRTTTLKEDSRTPEAAALGSEHETSHPAGHDRADLNRARARLVTLDPVPRPWAEATRARMALPDTSCKGAPRVRIMSLGCRLNEAEAEDWAERFQVAGLAIVADDGPADLTVINTCAVTQEAVRKSRQLLRRQQRRNPDAKLIVSGCLATLGDAALAPAAGVDLIITNRDKDRLVEIALAALTSLTHPAAERAPDQSSTLFIRGRDRAFIKVQDGCRYRCTFCVTTLARGPEQSRPAAEVIAAIARLVARGIQEVVLTGVHLGGYEDDQGEDLLGLIRRILAETEIARLRLGSLEPWGLSTDFWGLFEDRRLMPHLHLPLQSGSDRILRRMARRCKSAQFAHLVALGRERIPDLNVTTDVIVGFPGESADDWQRTLDMVATVRFAHVHAFSFSPRPGTAAANFPDQIEETIKRQRQDDLQSLVAHLRGEILREQVGKRVEILAEGAAPSDLAPRRHGYTPNYLPVQLATAAPIAPSRILPVILTGVSAEGELLIGHPVDDGADRHTPDGPIMTSTESEGWARRPSD